MPRITSKASKRTANPKSKPKETEDANSDAEMPNDGAADMDENLLEMEIPPMPEPLMNADGSGQRLIITHIEVENFKSYYGRQIIGPFHQNFTAIIGPNGSGKSNVIDSLLFVFGYRAAKIRSKKLSILIHSSAGRDNIKSCTVSVFFKKIIVISRDEMQTVAGSEFVVSRTAYRDNSSRYMLNGRITQFKEIGSVLRKCGIDLVHNRFLILQGEVEHISLMKPKAQNENEEGMLEYLEDIIGSSRLKLPINKLLCKLSFLQEQRATQLVRLRHAEKEKLALEESAKTVVAKLRVENAIVIAHGKLHALKRLAMSDEIAELTPVHENLLSEIDAAQKELDEMTLNSKSLKDEQKKLQRALEKKQEALARVSADLGTKKQSVTKIEADKKRLITQQNKLVADIAKETEKIIELEGVSEKAANKLKKYEVDLAEAEKAIKFNSDEIEAKLPIVQERMAPLRETQQKLDTELGAHVITEDKSASELALAQEELINLRRIESNKRRIIADFNDQLAQMQEDFATKSKNLETSESNLPVLERTLEELKAEERNLRRNESEQDERVRNLRVEVEQNRQTVDQFRNASRLLQSLMEQSKSGDIKGIYGRLGDLGAIDVKYDVAISTTCGALDNIVVDCVETAQLCIKFLQRENLGIASFIALDKQQHYWGRIRNKPNTPENTPRLFDLIRVEDQNVLPAFYYALNDTLVAADIQSATRISMGSGHQRWRTVTLKGEVVEVSGAMTGGGNAQKRNRIGQEVKVNTSKDHEQSGRNIAALTEELKSAESRLSEIRQRLAQVQKSERDRQSDFSRTSSLVKNLKTDIEMLRKSICSLEQQIEIQSGELRNATVNPEIVQECSNKVERLKTANDEMSKKSDSLRLRLMDVTEKIDAVNDEVVGSFQRALREAEERKAVTEKGIAKENNAIASNPRNLKKARERKTDLEFDLAQVNENIETLDGKLSDVEEALTKLEEVLEECKVKVDEAESAYTESVQNARELNSGEMSASKRVGELRDEASKTLDRLERYQAKISAVDVQISKLKLFNLRKLAGLPAEVLECGKDDALLNDSLSVFDQLDFADVENDHDDEEDEIMDASTSSANDEVGEDEAQDENDEDEMEIDGPRRVHSRQDQRKQNDGVSHLISMMRLPPFRDDAICREFDECELEAQLKALEDRKMAQKQKDSSANVGLLMDYIQRANLFDTETRDFQRISRERDLHREMCERLKKQRLQEFMEGFQLISEHLKEMYQMITLGGDASLDLVDSLDPFSEGVSFGVRPPKKSWKQITNLSGGEKTLASLALVFGLHHYRPTPLYVMDEIDAALDFRNVSIISSYILERTKNAQFIVISLRNNMFERGNRLVGIYKIHDCTHNAVIDPKAAQKVLIKNLKALKFAKRLSSAQEQAESQNLQDNESPMKLQTAMDFKELYRSPITETAEVEKDSRTGNSLKRRLFDKNQITETRKRNNFSNNVCLKEDVQDPDFFMSAD